jgi:hypothetical protein
MRSLRIPGNCRTTRGSSVPALAELPFEPPPDLLNEYDPLAVEPVIDVLDVGEGVGHGVTFLHAPFNSPCSSPQPIGDGCIPMYTITNTSRIAAIINTSSIKSQLFILVLPEIP